MTDESYVSHEGPMDPFTCPFCGEETKSLPNHIEHYCDEANENTNAQSPE